MQNTSIRNKSWGYKKILSWDALESFNKPSTVQCDESFQEQKLAIKSCLATNMLILVTPTWSKVVLFVVMMFLVNLDVCNIVYYNLYQKD